MNDVKFMEKPDDISFDEIHEVLWKANEANRNNGFILATSKMSGDELREYIGENGQCFVSLVGNKVVGTISIKYVLRDRWYARGRIAQYMLLAVLPEYQGHHISSQLLKIGFDVAQTNGCSVAELDTADNNKHAINIYQHAGFRCVYFKANPGGDHHSVIMAKWFGNCPFPDWYCHFRYHIRRLLIHMRYKPGRIKRFGV